MSSRRGTAIRNAAVFGGVAAIWLALDILTKRWADAATPGQLLAGGVPGVLDFRLVHNTGAAWGLLGDSTFGLGVFAIVFCVVLLVVAHMRRKTASVAEMAGYGLVLAGGVGNAVDRLTNGYVVDFIEASFVDFPVFNIADIGVTCGFAIIVLSIALSGRKSVGKA